MSISSAKAVYGLSAVGTPTSTGVSGTVLIGTTQTSMAFTGADVAYSLTAIFAGLGDALVLDMMDNDTTGSTAWVAGTAQVETATVTAASGITGSGNATVTVTASGMTGSPKAISVALTTTAHTTATLIAAAIAAALNLDTDYSAMFTASSSGADVITTRNATETHTAGSATVSIFPANDGTLNVAIANDTCTGITAAPTSANTTAGVATDGVKIYDGDGLDFEGNDIPTLSRVRGFIISNDGPSYGTCSGIADSFPIDYLGVMMFAVGDGGAVGTESSQTITAAGSMKVTITVIGATV